jgi:hypothetical protein
MVSRIPEHAHPKILLVHRAKEKTTRKAEEDANSERRARRGSSLIYQVRVVAEKKEGSCTRTGGYDLKLSASLKAPCRLVLQASREYCCDSRN